MSTAKYHLSIIFCIIPHNFAFIWLYINRGTTGIFVTVSKMVFFLQKTFYVLDDSAESSCYRNVNRRRTDLMPTIPSPRDNSRASLGSHTPRTPGSISE